jgi:hypothetical protein
MRKLLITGALLLTAAPALAQPPASDDEWAPDEAEMSVDPRAIHEMAQSMERLLGAVMDLPIGGIAAAVDPLGRSGYRPGDTVRDMATRDDPYAEERLRAGIAGSTRSFSAMSQALARMMPTLRRSMEEVRRSVEEAIEESDIGR